MHFPADESVSGNKRLAVNALTLCGIAFVSTDHNLVECAVVRLVTVIHTLVNRTADASVRFFFSIHRYYLRKIIARTAETVRANIS